MSQSTLQPAQPLHNRKSLLAKLAAWNLPVSTVDHEPLFTVAQSTNVHRDIAGAHTKNLFLKDKKGTLILITAAHATVVELKRLHAKIGCGRLSFASAERLMQYLGVTPGSVTPFALINDTNGSVRFFLDAHLANEDIINGHPLENTATTSIARTDLMTFAEKTGHTVTVLDLEADVSV